MKSHNTRHEFPIHYEWIRRPNWRNIDRCTRTKKHNVQLDWKFHVIGATKFILLKYCTVESRRWVNERKRQKDWIETGHWISPGTGRVDRFVCRLDWKFVKRSVAFVGRILLGKPQNLSRGKKLGSRLPRAASGRCLESTAKTCQGG